MIDIAEISRRLAYQAETIARYLLPGGRLHGREWTAGSTNGEPGKSLKVCVSGEKQGIWSDFATGESGDLIDLWRICRGLPLSEALKEIKEHLGISEPEWEGKKRRQYRRPEIPKAVKVAAKSPVMRYLTEERKLSSEAIAAYRIAEAESVGPWEGWRSQKPWNGPWIVLPSFRDKDLIGCKYLHVERVNGKKQTLVESGCEPILFGWQAIDPNARQIVVCEGELDALSLWMYGHPAVSVPFGGGKGDKQQWVENEWESLERFETIYLCLDSDEEGRAAVQELVGRLGAYRCRIVTLPEKDANKCLQCGTAKEAIDECFRNAVEIAPEELRRPDSFTNEVLDEFFPKGGVLPGFPSPWQEWKFRFLRGEVSLWSGINGHGKSLLLNQVILTALKNGERACIGSFEMLPKKTLYRMVRQATALEHPPKSEVAKCLEWLSNGCWIFNLVGTAKVDRMMEVFEYAWRRYGVRQFVIDSMMKCGIAEDDYNGQKSLMECLCDFVLRTDAHVHMVAHVRKGESEKSEIGKMDIRGSGTITDLAFNVFSVIRNKRKEQILSDFQEHGTLPKGETLEKVQRMPDTILICSKARNVEQGEGRVSLMYDGPSMQFTKGRPHIYFRSEEQEIPL